MSERRASWSIPGPEESERRPILGDVHHPDGTPRGTILIAHGFKGYKDYGMFPRLARAMAAAGYVAHRFNFSHSGMTNDLATFARPDLFERDTWNRQVADYRRVVEAVQGGELDGAGLPFVMFGHSRGGATTLLAAGRCADDEQFPRPAGLITAAAPSSTNMLGEREIATMLEQGFIVSPSSRTGQELRIGRQWYDEQQADPAGHDLLALVGRIRCPMLIVHGEQDPTVPASMAVEIARAAGERARTIVIPGGDHVFNTPNPMADDAVPSDQLRALIEAWREFADVVCTP